MFLCGSMQCLVAVLIGSSAETKHSSLPTDHQLALYGLIVTVVLGVVAIVVAVRADHRAENSSRKQMAELSTIGGSVNDLETVTRALNDASRNLSSVVEAVAVEVASLRGEAMDLITKSYMKLLDAKLQRDDHASLESTSAEVDKQPVPDLRHHNEQEDELTKESIPTQEQVYDTLRELGRGGRSVTALDLFSRFEPGGAAYYTVKRLYELRTEGAVSWSDAILSPDTVVESRK